MRGPQTFRPAWWVMGSVLLLGGGLVAAGLYGLATGEVAGGLVAAGFGVFLLCVLQIGITVSPHEVVVQHVCFRRRYAMSEIARLTHLTTHVMKYGCEVDRTATVVLQLRGGREVELRPADANALIRAIQRAQAA